MDRLIPETLFAELPQWALLLVCAAALAILIKAADVLVDAIAGIAYRMRVSKVVVAATVLSMGTTSPEAAVSIMGSLSGSPELALGNAVGSIVANAALIFGLGLTLSALPVQQHVLRRQGAWMLGACLVLAGIAYVQYMVNPAMPTIGRGAGAAMLLLLGVYVAMNVVWSRSGRAEHDPVTRADLEAASTPGRPRSMPALIGISVAALVFVLLASRLFVVNITILAEDHWFIPKVIVAATIVSIGTSLPEVVVSVTSVLKGHGEVLIGNVIGANVMNVLMVIGAASLARPLTLLEAGSTHPAVFLTLHLPAMLLVVTAFCACILYAERNGRFARSFGPAMLMSYVCYVVLQFVFR